MLFSAITKVPAKLRDTKAYHLYVTLGEGVPTVIDGRGNSVPM